MNRIDVRFTNCYRLLDVANPKISGEFSRTWDGKYESISNEKKSKYTRPASGGSQIDATSIFLVDSAPDEIKESFNQNEVLYLLFSDQFSVIYVGLTTKGIKNGVFGRGRLIHHIRKLVASPTDSTNHTKGWADHAIERYGKTLNHLNIGENPTTEDLLGDIWIAVGVSADSWQSRNYEGTVLSYFKDRFNEIAGQSFRVLNSAGVRSMPAIVREPANLKNMKLGL
jgi:hypothetical protein